MAPASCLQLRQEVEVESTGFVSPEEALLRNACARQFLKPPFQVFFAGGVSLPFLDDANQVRGNPWGNF